MGARFQFFDGDDEFLVERAARTRFEEFSQDAADDFSREIIDAASQKVDDAESALDAFISAVRTLPMFGGKKYVWLRNMNWLSTDSVLGRSEGGEACVARLLKVLETVEPESVGVVISAFPANRVRSATKWLEANGESTVIKSAGKASPFAKTAAKVPDAVVELMESECRSSGVKIGSAARQKLFDKTGGNTRLLLEELRKLVTYLGADGGEITAALVSKLVSDFGEGNFFEPVEAFFSGDLALALETLHRFFFHNPDGARPLFTALQNRTRLLIQLRALMDSGEIRATARLDEAGFAQAAAVHAKHFEADAEKTSLNVFTQNVWYLGNSIAPATQLFSLRQLTELQLGLVEGFAALLARPGEPEPILRELFVRGLGSAHARRA
ncbi:MAG: DNA polymerase III subunit delta [Puniceicoccales bacterium]|jgi:DNA polymerase-3 subunit delta|nr:DNA polymerase III subunit delta [Puniceicoccales bacterium]